uniref:Uncharacterized protein n=1 Tax=Rhizophagus irregularis (strain DAOM 181602 / DAOM 197198 / MUCL 43194) TaxID=747089 RepID=U9UQH4_RHIID
MFCMRNADSLSLILMVQLNRLQRYLVNDFGWIETEYTNSTIQYSKETLHSYLFPPRQK